MGEIIGVIAGGEHRLYRKILVLIVVALAGCALAGPAAANNWPSARLDDAASAVAGHPVQVWCEESWGDWIHAGDYDDEDWSYVFGFTYLSEPTVYINPTQCETLHALQRGEQVGSYHASLAIQTLAHESVHQRGIEDEGVTECTALPLVKGLAVSHFGIPRMVVKPKIVSYTKKIVRRVNGKSVSVKVQAQKSVRVRAANPYLAKLAADALRWHRTLPAEYQGAC